MNRTLFIGSLKANLGLVIGVTLFTLIYVTVSISMFEPQSTEIIDALLQMIPEQMIKAMGFDQLTGELTSYLGGYLFGFILLTFPLIYSVVTANGLVVKMVDNGSMSYLLTSTNTRKKVILTQYVYLAFGLMLIFLIDYLITVLMSAILFPGLLMMGAYFKLNLVTYLASLFTASIAFLFSCVFNETRMATMASSAVGGIFLVLHMIASLSEDIEFLKYFTVYSLVDVQRCLTDSSFVVISSILLLLASGLIAIAAIFIFDRKSLTI